MRRMTQDTTREGDIMKDAIKAWGIQDLAIVIAQAAFMSEGDARDHLKREAQPIIDRHGLNQDDVDQANVRVRRILDKRSKDFGGGDMR